MQYFDSATEARKFVKNQPKGKWLVTQTVYSDGSGSPCVSVSENPREFFSDEFHGEKLRNAAGVFESLDEALAGGKSPEMRF